MRAPRPARGPASALVAAVACSNTADGVTRLGLPLLVLAGGGSSSAVAWVAAAGIAPWLVVSLPAGVALDHGRPDRWARTAHVARAVLLAAAALAIAGPWANPPTAGLVVLAAGLGCAEVIADLAAQTLAPRTTGDRGLAGLNARVSAAQLVAIVTHRQATTPPYLLGRINATFQTVGIGAATLGTTTAAAVQPALSHRQVLTAAALAGAAGLAALRPSRALPRT